MPNSYPATPSTNTYSPQAHTNGDSEPMEGRQAEYAQPGLSSPLQHLESGQPSEEHSADQASAAQYSQGQDVKFNPSATPNAEYAMTPQSARSGHFPEYAPRPGYPDQRYQQTSAGQHPNMPPPQSPSQALSDGTPNYHQDATINSDNDVPVDPNIAASSPTYPPHPPQYPPHYPQHDMHYAQPPPMYGRPGEFPPGYGHPYAGYGPPPMMRPGPPGGGVPLSTVYSFVPIPGTHQQKRPRRRYEEIERMYKCGWQGCEKAYGTLNHLNAHVTMQAHGIKRTPEEFKEIRKEWKQRKKEDDQQRKAEDDRHHQGGPPGSATSDGQSGAEGAQSSAGYTQGRALPPLGYSQATGGPPLQPQPYPQADGNVPQYSGQYYQQGPGSPYAGQSNQMYTQNQGPPATTEVQPVADGA